MTRSPRSSTSTARHRWTACAGVATARCRSAPCASTRRASRDRRAREGRATLQRTHPGAVVAEAGAEGGIRTHTRLPSAVFETAASAIPPLRPGRHATGPGRARQADERTARPRWTNHLKPRSVGNPVEPSVGWPESTRIAWHHAGWRSVRPPRGQPRVARLERPRRVTLHHRNRPKGCGVWRRTRC